MAMMALLAACRFARDGAALMLWGSSVMLALFTPLGLRAHLALRCWRARRGAVLVLVGAVLALLPVEAAQLGDGWADAIDPRLLRVLLLQTTIGTAWLAQATSLCLVLFGAALPGRWQTATMAVGTGLLLASLSLTGHAALQEDALGAVHRGNAILHLLAVGFWVGALVPLLPTLDALQDPRHHAAAAVALRRFSMAGHGAVGVAILTGGLNTTLILGAWTDGWSSPYRRLLVGKIGIVLCMTGLALINRYVFVPRVRQAPASTIRRIKTATLIEMMLGSIAVALVAIFAQLEPL